jgi:hypothetical protein
MEHLFGVGNVEMVFVTRRGPEGARLGLSRGVESRCLSWRSLLDLLEVPASLPRFVQTAIDLCSLPEETQATRVMMRRVLLADGSVLVTDGEAPEAGGHQLG